LQRVAADYKSRLGEVGSELALARQRSAELRSRIAQLRLTYQTQATDELKDAAGRVRELEERLRPSKDQVERQIVRAPVDGEVMSLRVSARGAVIAPREPLLDVVPQREKLVVDARIEPRTSIMCGSAVRLRQLISADTRLRRRCGEGDLRFRRPRDTAGDRQGVVRCDCRGRCPALKQHQPTLHLQAGMLAELYVTTGERTPFEYPRNRCARSRKALRESG
jgi:hypothetical protein